MRRCLLLSLFLVLLSSQLSWADTAEDRIKSVFKGQSIEIKSYDEQLKEIQVGAKTYFASSDGRYIFAGAVFDTESRQDLIELRTQAYRLARTQSLDDDMYLSFPAKGDAQHTVTVFTDIDCPYCRKLHEYMDEYNALGVTVNYVMLPRGGLKSRSYDKTVSALCDDNPTHAMTRAMAGENLKNKSCVNKVAEQFHLARELEINSTPTFLLPDGSLKLGLVSPSQLSAILKATSK